MATEISYQSQLPQLLTALMGQKQTTSSTSTANTNSLEQLFASAMGASSAGTPEMQSLISSIFQEGATKVPELTQAFANATGSRTTGNSGLALSLSDLNRKISTDAAVAVLNNQNTNRQLAGQAASGIAQATRGTNQTQVTRSGVNPLLLALGGTALNRLDKSKALDWLKSPANGMAPVSDAVPILVDNVNNADFGPASMPLDTNGDYGSFGSFGSDAVSGLGDISMDGLDFGPDPMGLDFSFDPGIDFGTGADFGSLDLGSFFADGGQVARNKNYMGARPVARPVMSAETMLANRPRVSRNQGVGVSNDPDAGSGAAQATPAAIGTPAQNEAAINGFVSALAGFVTAVPGLSTALNSAINGKSLPAIAITSIANAADSATSGLSPDSVAAATGIDGINNGGLAGLGISLGLDAGVTGNSAADNGPGGSSASGSGVNADGSAASGVDGDSGVGGIGAYSEGGKVKGPGTGTSDSIRVKSRAPGGKDIYYSADEYVIPAAVVRRIGTDTLDRIISGNLPAGVEMEDEDE